MGRYSNLQTAKEKIFLLDEYAAWIESFVLESCYYFSARVVQYILVLSENFTLSTKFDKEMIFWHRSSDSLRLYIYSLLVSIIMKNWKTFVIHHFPYQSSLIIKKPAMLNFDRMKNYI